MYFHAFTHIKRLEKPGNTYYLIVRVEKGEKLSHPKIKQKGILRDKSGQLRYTLWTNSGHSALIKGKVYILQKARLAQFRDSLEIHITQLTQIELYNKRKFTAEIDKEKQEIDKQPEFNDKVQHSG